MLTEYGLQIVEVLVQYILNFPHRDQPAIEASVKALHESRYLTEKRVA